jgi:hypothetical protein
MGLDDAEKVVNIQSKAKERRCEVFDSLIMERHLCADCVVIPPEINIFFRQLVRESVCAYKAAI